MYGPPENKTKTHIRCSSVRHRESIRSGLGSGSVRGSRGGPAGWAGVRLAGRGSVSRPGRPRPTSRLAREPAPVLVISGNSGLVKPRKPSRPGQDPVSPLPGGAVISVRLCLPAQTNKGRLVSQAGTQSPNPGAAVILAGLRILTWTPYPDRGDWGQPEREARPTLPS